MPELKRREGHRHRYYCKGGIQELSYYYLNGCIQIWPKVCGWLRCTCGAGVLSGAPGTGMHTWPA